MQASQTRRIPAGELAMAKQPGVLLLLLAVSCTALAQRGYVAIEQRLTPEQLREVGITPQQLARLDEFLRAAEAASPAPPVADAGFDPARFAGMDTGRIATRANGTVMGWAPGCVFKLANGQQWKVLKGNLTLPKPLRHPPIVLVPGVAGRWFLQVDEDLPKARVYRID